MIHVMVQVQVEDFDRFWKTFSTTGLELRYQHGSRAAHIYQDPQDPKRLTLLFEWESEERMRGFFADATVRETMKSGGTLNRPEPVVLNKVGELPG